MQNNAPATLPELAIAIEEDEAWMNIIMAGWLAGYAGDDPRGNPYPKLSEEWRCWNRWHAFGVESHQESLLRRPLERTGT